MFGVIAFRNASTSPNRITLKPGVNGPKPSRYCSSVEKLTIVTVRPWKWLAQTMISAFDAYAYGTPEGVP